VTRLCLRGATRFLFDLDGTLVDSSALHDHAYRRVLAEHAPWLLAGFDYESVKGKSTEDGLAAAGIRDPEALVRLAALKQLHYRAAVLGGQLEPIAGALELLTALRGRGHALYLVTSGSRGSVSIVMEATGLDVFFSGIVTASDVVNAKPAPDAFLLCLQRYSLAPEDCVVVEDAPSGVAAARAAGLAVIGVNNPAVSGLADLYFETLGEMKGLASAPATEEETYA
jgi:HAD superfamily hydrolase (TIGR01509 family)